MKELEFLKEQNVSEDLIHGVAEFRKNYGTEDQRRKSSGADGETRHTERRRCAFPGRKHSIIHAG